MSMIAFSYKSFETAFSLRMRTFGHSGGLLLFRLEERQELNQATLHYESKHGTRKGRDKQKEVPRFVWCRACDVE